MTERRARSTKGSKPGGKPDTVSTLVQSAGGRKSPPPQGLKPMLASLTKTPFDDPDWLFEVKWDGYRALGYVQKGKVELVSRNKIPFTGRYPSVVEALQQWKCDAIVDGEIIVLNEEGIPDFQQLQSWQSSGKGQLVYYLFDVLWVDGYSVMHLPLRNRKEILRKIVKDGAVVKYSDHLEEGGVDFFSIALQKGLEGVMGKKADSAYHPGVRTQQWLKIKTHKTQEAVIAGFTEGRGGRKHFGALILGIYDHNNEFVYIGHTGSGLDSKGLATLYKKLEPLITDHCPFRKKPKTNMAATWVKPRIVCEVKFQEWTKDNILRIPIFLHVRTDKKAAEIKREEPVQAAADHKKKKGRG